MTSVRGLARALIVACALARPAAAAEPEPELSLAAYLVRIEQVADAVRITTSPAQAAVLADLLPDAWTVRVGSERVKVPASALAAALRDPAWPAGRDRALATAQAMQAEAARLAAGSSPPPPHLRKTLAEILHDPAFGARNQDHVLMRWAQRIRDWIRSWFPGLPAAAAGTVKPVLTWTSIGVAAIAFVVLALTVWRTLRRAGWETARVARAAAAEGEPADAGAWAARARAAAAAGDAREAIRCAYHAVLHRLDEDGVWTIEDARTPREYLRLVPAHDARQPAVAAVARLFEGTWYGGREAGPGEAQAAIGRLGELGCDVQPDPAI
jgi:hypothetical protein